MEQPRLAVCRTCNARTPHTVSVTMGGRPVRVILTCRVCGTRRQERPDRPIEPPGA